MVDKTEILYWHLNYNYYPPIPSEVQNEICGFFNEYWSGNISFDTLCTKMNMEPDDLFKQYSPLV